MEQPQPFRKQKRISDKNLSLSRKIRGYAILAKEDMPIREVRDILPETAWVTLETPKNEKFERDMEFLLS